MKRQRAHDVPNVARKAMAAQQSDGIDRRILMGAADAFVVVLIIGLAVMLRGGGVSQVTVRLILTSPPPGATVTLDDRNLGRPPVDIDVAAQSDPFAFRFELEGHEMHRVQIGTEEPELRYEARLVPLTP